MEDSTHKKTVDDISKSSSSRKKSSTPTEVNTKQVITNSRINTKKVEQI
jgi:hypothetical protein